MKIKNLKEKVQPASTTSTYQDDDDDDNDDDDVYAGAAEEAQQDEIAARFLITKCGLVALIVIPYTRWWSEVIPGCLYSGRSEAAEDVAGNSWGKKRITNENREYLKKTEKNLITVHQALLWMVLVLYISNIKTAKQWAYKALKHWGE